ncbi:hypothetical protein [Actinosynnema sp. NPDC020468]|uniref:hypothetical protein n=1 Tax=Actinosynnema sp. NPDC020468 TaxID=3154488 RepID=UPI0033D3FE10
MKPLLAALSAVLLLTACTTTVTGAGSGSGTRTTTAAARTTTGTTAAPTTGTTTAAPTTSTTARSAAPPSIDESAPARYCDRPFTGALGKEMLAVVVETPAGRLTCDQAGAVLFDYYAQRSEPRTGLPPIMVGTLSCNQVAEGQLPQVVCADEDNLVYSMWPQR